MGAYVLRRLLQAVPLLWLISVMVFLLLHVIPGGPMAAYENNPDMTAEDQQRLEHDLGLDVPLHVQYVRWLAALLHGDWGYSLASKRPVLVEIGDRLPNTVYLIGVATLVTLVLAVPIGIFSALRQYSTLDHVVTTIAFMGQSIPIFWFGLILIIIFSVNLKNPLAGSDWFPHAPPLPLFPGGAMETLSDNPPPPLVDRIWHLVLPVSMLAVFQLAQHVRYMRAGMLDVLKLDFIRTAHAKGLRERTVISR